MSRRLLALAVTACAIGVAPAYADPVPPQLRPGVSYNVDPSRGSASVGVWVGDYPLLGARVDGENGRVCGGYGYTTGVCSDQFVDVDPSIEIADPDLP